MTARQAILSIVIGYGSCALLYAQAPEDSGKASTNPLPAELTALLADVVDGQPNFDHPAYYALVRFVRANQTPPEAVAAETPLDAWSDLADRPSEFRGTAITIQGVVGRNKSHRYQGANADLGQVWQLELRAPNQPMSMTVICTGDVSDVPINGEIVVSGYFLMLRQFQTASGKTRYGGLMVAQGPTQVATGVPQAPQREAQPALWFGAIGIGLLIAIILMRRRQRTGVHDIRSLRSEKSAPIDLADDLAKWSQTEHRERRE